MDSSQHLPKLFTDFPSYIILSSSLDITLEILAVSLRITYVVIQSSNNFLPRKKLKCSSRIYGKSYKFQGMICFYFIIASDLNPEKYKDVELKREK